MSFPRFSIAIESTPQNLRKHISETTFGHSKVVFQPLLRTKRAFSQKALTARLLIFFVVQNIVFDIIHSKIRPNNFFPYIRILTRCGDSASSFYWLSYSLVRRPASVTSPLISTIWCFRAYKPYIFCKDMILATCQCQHIFYCWVEPSLLLSGFLLILKVSTSGKVK